MSSRRTRSILAAAACSVLFGFGASAADSLDELLEQTRNARAVEAKAQAALEEDSELPLLFAIDRMVPGGTLRVSQTPPPMTEPRPIVTRPRIVAPA